MSRELLSYRDPANGYSIFGLIGLDKTKIGDFRKAAELAFDNGDKQIKDTYSMIMNTPFENPSQNSMFAKSVDFSREALNIYLSMLSEIEKKYYFSSMVIPEIEYIQKMIPCPAFKEYMEACYKDIQPQGLYKAHWFNYEKD
jgi:hypothetical protein